jgi:hypothetical protein
MQQVLMESASPAQTDTIEGEVEDREYGGSCDMTFTSKFDIVAQRWVPVFSMLHFGRGADAHKPH